MNIIDQQQIGTLLGAIPGSVTPSIWQIRHSQGQNASVDLTNHVANLTGGLTIWDRAVDEHERGHIRWDLPQEKLGVLAPALIMPSILPWYKMMREWIIDARLVDMMPSHPGMTDPRIGMDRFDWTSMPDPQTATEETRAQWWCQHAYVYTGSKSQALRNYTGEIWSLLPSPVQSLLTSAFLEVTNTADLYNDDISAMWAVKLAAYWDSTRTQQAPQPPTSQEYQKAQAEATQNQAAQQQAGQQVGKALSAQGEPAGDATQQMVAQGVVKALSGTPGKDSTNGVGTTIAQTFASQGQGERGKQADGTGEKHKAGQPKTMMWSKDIVVCNHLTTASPGKRMKAPKGASEEGVVIVDLPRVFQDRRPFKNAPRPAGTVIVDTSGSMSWSQPELEEVIRRSPAVTVGLYSASGAPHGSGARICIVAKDGKAANLEKVMNDHIFSGGNNGSDAPALRWLADRHQKGPKFILSDGEFWDHYGPARTSNSAYQDDCTDIMRKAKILRVPTFKDMVEIANHRPANISDGAQKQYPTKRRANNR